MLADRAGGLAEQAAEFLRIGSCNVDSVTVRRESRAASRRQGSLGSRVRCSRLVIGSGIMAARLTRVRNLYRRARPALQHDSRPRPAPSSSCLILIFGAGVSARALQPGGGARLRAAARAAGPALRRSTSPRSSPERSSAHGPRTAMLRRLPLAAGRLARCGSAPASCLAEAIAQLGTAADDLRLPRRRPSTPCPTRCRALTSRRALLVHRLHVVTRTRAVTVATRAVRHLRRHRAARAR